jgi:hypothetical protein
MSPNDELLTDAELAEWFGVNPDAPRWWRSRHSGPPFVRINRNVRYRRGDVLAWLDAQRVTPQRVTPGAA